MYQIGIDPITLGNTGVNAGLKLTHLPLDFAEVKLTHP